MTDKTSGSENPVPGAIVLSEYELFPVISISGYWDIGIMHAVQQQVKELLRAKRTRIIIDVSHCRLANSPAMAGFLELLMQIVHDFSGKVALVGAAGTLKRIMNMIGVFRFAMEAPTVDAGAALLERE
ncbi:MAG TPA: STAS domain-containing protein [Candidatus Ozemobacteraceae bacterium]|nr:STAS domain-containing protein [Candidatus Ozemobacteraceae bacterium]